MMTTEGQPTTRTNPDCRHRARVQTCVRGAGSEGTAARSARGTRRSRTEGGAAVAAQVRAATQSAPDEVLMPRQLKDVVYARLRQDIVELKIPPGEPAQGGRARSAARGEQEPLREAYGCTERAHAVQGRGRRGIQPGGPHEIYGLRGLPRGRAAGGCAGGHPGDLAKLERISENLGRLGGNGSRHRCFGVRRSPLPADPESVHRGPDNRASRSTCTGSVSSRPDPRAVRAPPPPSTKIFEAILRRTRKAPNT